MKFKDALEQVQAIRQIERVKRDEAMEPIRETLREIENLFPNGEVIVYGDTLSLMADKGLGYRTPSIRIGYDTQKGKYTFLTTQAHTELYIESDDVILRLAEIILDFYPEVMMG